MRKLDRVKNIHTGKVGTIWGEPYNLIGPKGQSKWIEVLYDNEDMFKDVEVEDLELYIDSNKLHIWDLIENKSLSDMMEKLFEEVKEVELELIKPISCKADLASELLDVMQVCTHIAFMNNIELDKFIQYHNMKLENRGHKIISK